MLNRTIKKLIQEIIERSFDRFKGSLAKPTITHGFMFALKEHPANLRVSDAYVHASAVNSLRDNIDKGTICS